MQPDRWFGVGSAGGVDAGARAADDALRHDRIERLTGIASGAPAAGFYNQTLVVLAIS